MAHYGLLREFRFDDLGTADDIRGSNVYGRDDDKLGTIDDVVFDHSSGAIRYVVVDTGGWFSSKKFLVPAHRLHSSAKHENHFAINLDKQQIESLPRYNESDLESEETWGNYEKQYDAAWHSGPVQHRKGSDRDITPTPDEFSPEPGSIGQELSPSERAEINSRIIPATANEVTIQSSGTGIGSRWLTFEQRLRQRRHDITRACTTCASSPAADRSAERVEPQRKVS
ncbi:MAG: PRC-barrel domain-containing protein [Acidobacteria bacterium]|nr:PRC-barrel domain-containing protein [Acidobacteriota bacterium]